MFTAAAASSGPRSADGQQAGDGLDDVAHVLAAAEVAGQRVDRGVAAHPDARWPQANATGRHLIFDRGPVPVTGFSTSSSWLRSPPPGALPAPLRAARLPSARSARAAPTRSHVARAGT